MTAPTTAVTAETQKELAKAAEDRRLERAP